MALKWSRDHICSWSMKARLGKRVIKVLKNIWNCAIGKTIVNEFVQVRLIKKEVKFHDSLKQQKLKTFETLYSVPVSLDKSKTVAIKAETSSSCPRIWPWSWCGHPLTTRTFPCSTINSYTRWMPETGIKQVWSWQYLTEECESKSTTH